MSSVAQIWPELELFLEAISVQRILLFQIFSVDCKYTKE
jgi:hypothetical protein